MPSIVENRPMPPLPEAPTSGRTPFAAVILRVPDLNHQATSAAGMALNSARVWNFRARLPSASSFLKGLTSRVLLAAIAMSAVAIFYMALNGTSPPPKSTAPKNNIPLISSLPNRQQKSPSATVLIPDPKSSNNGLFQDLPRPSPVLPSTAETRTNSNVPASVSPEPSSSAPPASTVQPIRSVPAVDQGPVLLGPNGDQAAMSSATLSNAARREVVFSWGQAEFNGGINKAPLAKPFAPTQGNLR